MLARANRLTSGRSFAGAVRRGRRCGRPTMVVHLDLGSEEQPRVGLVVGKAVGSAVTRNQVKRRLRHLARARLETLPGNAVLVVRALPAAGSASSAVLARDLDVALARLVGEGLP